MSYNITNWKTKKIKDFCIPVKALYDIDPDLIRRGWSINPYGIEKGSHDNSWFANSKIIIDSAPLELKGVLLQGIIHVDYFNLAGEGSGFLYEHIIKPALKQSAGKLKAITIWEGGDCIMKLAVNNGVITEKGIGL